MKFRCLLFVVVLSACFTRALFQSCGLDKFSGKRIIGGRETAANQYPWMVRLPSGCGGSLITDRHILTALHCVDKIFGTRNPTFRNPISATNYWKGKMVKVGVHNQNDRNDYSEVPVKEIKWPKINFKDEHDFAMIILDQAVDLTDKAIGTVCLPNGPNEDYRGKKVVAMGWGDTIDKGSGQSPVLKHVGLTVSYWAKSPKYLNTEIGRMNNEKQVFCHGDSGGPLVYKNVQTGRWTIIGTANAYNGPRGGTCLTAYTNIWNKITAHYAWIKENIRNTGLSSCQDKRPDKCWYFKTKCSNDSSGWMKKNCAKTCGLCVACEDKDTGCPGWAKNYCESVVYGDHREWMTENCPKSCNKCPRT